MTLKSIGHRNIETWTEKVEEELMAMARAQEQQRHFFSTLLSVRRKKRQRKSRKEKANRNQ
jgi:hypothetical protein